MITRASPRSSRGGRLGAAYAYTPVEGSTACWPARSPPLLPYCRAGSPSETSAGAAQPRPGPGDGGLRVLAPGRAPGCSPTAGRGALRAWLVRHRVERAHRLGLRLYAPAVLALALNELLGSSFHAHQDTLTPMRAGLLACRQRRPLRRPHAGARHRGIALATTSPSGEAGLPRRVAPHVFTRSRRDATSPRWAWFSSRGGHVGPRLPRCGVRVDPGGAPEPPLLALVVLSLLCLSAYAAPLAVRPRLLLVHVACCAGRSSGPSAGWPRRSRFRGQGAPRGPVVTRALAPGLRRGSPGWSPWAGSPAPAARADVSRVNDLHPHDRLSVSTRPSPRRWRRSPSPPAVVSLADALAALRGDAALPAGRWPSLRRRLRRQPRGGAPRPRALRLPGCLLRRHGCHRHVVGIPQHASRLHAYVENIS